VLRAPLIWVGADARRRMLEEADARYPNETGGVIVGYRAKLDEYVVTAVSGPGPRAVHAARKFNPDHDFQVDWLARRYAASNRVETYLGDWHTHPNATTAEPSWTDRRAAAAIADCPDARAAIPIMVIANGRAGDWRLHAWTFEARPVLAVFSLRRFVRGSVVDFIQPS
jgi:integrative and conjugative element protein (TIGR02256 family)